MTLEETILELTSRTPSGGRCRIGEDFFSVWYCSDIWEWEYRGVTYFDAQDLAEAMMQASLEAVGPLSVPGTGRSRASSHGRSGRPKASMAGLVGAPARKESRAATRGRARGSTEAPVVLAIRHPRSRAPGGAVARTPCGDPCPCATPCAKVLDRTSVHV